MKRTNSDRRSIEVVQAGLVKIFRADIDEGAFAPLVAEFRKWNWKWNYDEDLLELTARLQENRERPLLKELWVAVVAKRRTSYNKTRKAQQSVPNKIPDTLVTKTQGIHDRANRLSPLFRTRCKLDR